MQLFALLSLLPLLVAAYNPFFPPSVPVSSEQLNSRAYLEEYGRQQLQSAKSKTLVDRSFKVGAVGGGYYPGRTTTPPIADRSLGEKKVLQTRGKGEGKRGMVKKVKRAATACAVSSGVSSLTSIASSAAATSIGGAPSVTLTGSSVVVSASSQSASSATLSSSSSSTQTQSSSSSSSSSASSPAPSSSSSSSSASSIAPSTSSSSSSSSASSSLTPSSSSSSSSSSSISTSSSSSSFSSVQTSSSSAPSSSSSASSSSSSSSSSPIQTSTKTTQSTTSTTSTTSSAAATSSASSVTVDTYGVGPFSGYGTWFYDGLSACGTYDTDAMPIVAVSAQLFDNWPGYNGLNPNNNPICGHHLNITWGGKSLVAEVTDRCPGCDIRSLDLSIGAFQHFADLGVGMFSDGYTGNLTWSWVSGTGRVPQVTVLNQGQ